MVKHAPDSIRSRHPAADPRSQDLDDWERRFPGGRLQREDVARQRPGGGRGACRASGTAVAHVHATKHADLTTSSARAQKAAAVPADEPSAEKFRLTTDPPLPYDSEEWERCLAVARVRGEKVLKQRADERLPAASLEPGATAAGSGIVSADLCWHRSEKLSCAILRPSVRYRRG